MIIMIRFILVAMFAAASADPSDVHCCREGQGVLQDGHNKCVDSENVVTPINFTCDKVEQVFNLDFTITEDGILYLILGEQEISLDKGTYCVSNGTSNSTERVLVVCSDSEEDLKIVNEEILGYCMLVSAVFLFFTVLAYCILPEIRDLLGKSVINMCTSLGLGLCILGGMNLLEYSDMKLCAVRGFFVYFFLLASFFWTNAISIQLLLNIRRPTTADYGWKQFLWYALYAYGLPALLTIAMAIVNFLPGRHSKPGIGLNTCWFFDKKQQWYYMYSIMSILIAANICIFIYLSLYLWRGSYKSSHVKSLRYKFTMTVRMILVMGLPWIFEMISSLCRPHIIWAILDIFNTLQGPLIFLVLVVLRRRVVKALHQRGYLGCISGPLETHLAVSDDEEYVVDNATDHFDKTLPYYMISSNHMENTMKK